MYPSPIEEYMLEEQLGVEYPKIKFVYDL